jgi:hypothetical protein
MLVGAGRLVSWGLMTTADVNPRTFIADLRQRLAEARRFL